MKLSVHLPISLICLRMMGGKKRDKKYLSGTGNKLCWKMCVCFDLFKHAFTSTQTLTHTLARMHTYCSTVCFFYIFFIH